MNYLKILGWYLVLTGLINLGIIVYSTNWSSFLSVAPSQTDSVTLSVSTLGMLLIIYDILFFPYTALSIITMGFANAFLGSFGIVLNFFVAVILPALIILGLGILLFVRYGSKKSKGGSSRLRTMVM